MNRVTALLIGGKSTALKLLVTVFITGLVAGTLDAVAAIFILAKGHAVLVFQYIASGVYGKAAFKGGADMVLCGVFFHYLIAMSFTIGYFVIYPYIPVVRKSFAASAVLYGLFTWAVMTLIVVPMTLIHKQPFSLKSALLNAVILMFTIGLPVTYMRRRYDNSKQILS